MGSFHLGKKWYSRPSFASCLFWHLWQRLKELDSFISSVAITLYADVVLKSPDFLELSHANLCDILRRGLNADELTVYNSALAWAQAVCAR